MSTDNAIDAEIAEEVNPKIEKYSGSIEDSKSSEADLNAIVDEKSNEFVDEDVMLEEKSNNSNNNEIKLDEESSTQEKVNIEEDEKSANIEENSPELGDQEQLGKINIGQEQEEISPNQEEGSLKDSEQSQTSEEGREKFNDADNSSTFHGENQDIEEVDENLNSNEPQSFSLEHPLHHSTEIAAEQAAEPVEDQQKVELTEEQADVQMTEEIIQETPPKQEIEDIAHDMKEEHMSEQKEDEGQINESEEQPKIHDVEVKEEDPNLENEAGEESDKDENEIANTSIKEEAPSDTQLSEQLNAESLLLTNLRTDDQNRADQNTQMESNDEDNFSQGHSRIKHNEDIINDEQNYQEAHNEQEYQELQHEQNYQEVNNEQDYQEANHEQNFHELQNEQNYQEVNNEQNYQEVNNEQNYQEANHEQNYQQLQNEQNYQQLQNDQNEMDDRKSDESETNPEEDQMYEQDNQQQFHEKNQSIKSEGQEENEHDPEAHAQLLQLQQAQKAQAQFLELQQAQQAQAQLLELQQAQAQFAQLQQQAEMQQDPQAQAQLFELHQAQLLELQQAQQAQAQFMELQKAQQAQAQLLELQQFQQDPQAQAQLLELQQAQQAQERLLELQQLHQDPQAHAQLLELQKLQQLQQDPQAQLLELQKLQQLQQDPQAQAQFLEMQQAQLLEMQQAQQVQQAQAQLMELQQASAKQEGFHGVSMTAENQFDQRRNDEMPMSSDPLHAEDNAEGESYGHLDGVNLEGDEYFEQPDTESNVPEIDDTINNVNEPKDEIQEFLIAREEEEYVEAKKEQMVLMASESEHFSLEDMSNEDKRFEYLMRQSEVFAHFLAGSVAAEKRKGGRKSTKHGRKHKFTEAEEDSQMLKIAQMKRRTVRLEKQPNNLSAECNMHPYQVEGLNWLIKLHDHGLNGILADGRGLGKTLQAISLIAYLREKRGTLGPHIVVAPKGVVGHWMKEFRKWCPSIKVQRMHATNHERERVITNILPPTNNGKYRFDVLVTSYEAVVKAHQVLSSIPWQYCMIDEAHRNENEKSTLIRAIRTLKCRFKVLVTAFPLQSNFHALWAILNFILPEIFGDADQFIQWFTLANDEQKYNVLKRLQTVVRAFMIQRTKEEVTSILPPKKEIKIFIGLTALQREWYKKVLRKDAHELNCLGGPDKVRLLNILIQLRKVCNHPYLCDNVEPGPPYTDGPHLWEASGKMLTLHKILPRLQINGSRVLIFTQMTRQLDILEDYCRLIGYEYCRFDSSTDGVTRDLSVESFNRIGSEKFIFLLSTRAAGLSINLCTADTIILYDSDLDPQVDLLAQDRCHRFGQPKAVQIFRFVTEESMEEKIVEGADKKLLLDTSMTIPHGRNSEKNGSIDKNELMYMLKFGADEILNGKGGTYQDEDLETIILRGEQRTTMLLEKLQSSLLQNPSSFSMMDNNEETLNMEGSHSNEDGNFMTMPKRQRKRNYDVDNYYREAMNVSPTPQREKDTEVVRRKKRKTGPTLYDFQLYDRERLEQIFTKERALEEMKEAHLDRVKELRRRAKDMDEMQSAAIMEEAAAMEAQLPQFSLPAEEAAERDELLAQGFSDWTRKDFKSFAAAVEKYGRYDIEKIVEDVSVECHKPESEVKRYFIAFWMNYKRIQGWEKVLDKIERGEKRIQRVRQIRDAIKEKVERHFMNTFGYIPGEEENVPGRITSVDEMIQHAWPSLSFHPSSGYHKSARPSYQEEEDAFILCMMYKHGYTAAEKIRLEIRRQWQFRLNWFFKSRNAVDIQKRCDFLLKVTEKENEELKRKEQVQQHQQQQQIQQQVAPQMNLNMNMMGRNLNDFAMDYSNLQNMQGMFMGRM